MILGTIHKVMARCTMITPIGNIQSLLDFFKNFGFSKCYLGPVVNAPGASTKYDFTEDDYFDFEKQCEEMLPCLIEALSRKESPIYNHYDKYMEPFSSSLRFCESKCYSIERAG